MKVNLKYEVIDILVNEFGFSKQSARVAYRAVLIALKRLLLSGIEVKIESLGKFSVKNMKARKVKSPLTIKRENGIVEVPARKSLSFQTSRVFKKMLNKDDL